MTDYHNIYENTVTVFFYLHKIIVKLNKKTKMKN